jgi:hypothetical protein
MILTIHHNDGFTDQVRRTQTVGGSRVDVKTTDANDEAEITFTVKEPS